MKERRVYPKECKAGGYSGQRKAAAGVCRTWTATEGGIVPVAEKKQGVEDGG